MLYHLNLLDEHGRLLASEPFWAEDDQEACEAGATVLQTCKDAATQFEVRCNGVVVAGGQHQRALFDMQTIIDRRQANIIDLEDRLQRGFTAVALSRRLLRATNHLRRLGLL
jgi:hypothetical protein